MWEKVHIGNGNPLHRHEDYSHRSRQFSHAISGRFTKKGMTPAYIYSRTRKSAEQLSERLRDVPCSTDISQVPTDGDLYIFAVKDSALLDLVSRMPANRGLWVHTAGSMDMEVFAPYTARYGVFYPMQTFSKERETDFDDIPILSKRTIRTIPNVCKNWQVGCLQRFTKRPPNSASTCIWLPCSPATSPITSTPCATAFCRNTGCRSKPCCRSYGRLPRK